MVQYNDELKQEIRNANDIVDVISQYVILKRSGKNLWMRYIMWTLVKNRPKPL